ncbi:hypothetical protein PTKIN_Ptkin08bG0114100 [Pterospermum kingtungense]
MVAVFNKELLSWYLITLKLRETVESGIPRSSTGTTKSLEFPEEFEHQQHVAFDSSCRNSRACYEGTIPLSSNEFVEMLVLDIPASWLLGIQLGEPDQKGKVAKLAIRFFDPLMPTDKPLAKSEIDKLGSSLRHTDTLDPFSDLGGLHCLDVFRRILLSSGPKPLPRMWLKKSSERLVLKFKKRKTDRFWDIKFKNGILRIPRLLIHDGTKSLFLNLIAFEKCHLDCSNDITSYVIFMDNLINSHEDVGYLHYFGIIEHWLGSDAEVADLFNRLCQEATKAQEVMVLANSRKSSRGGDDPGGHLDNFRQQFVTVEKEELFS